MKKKTQPQSHEGKASHLAAVETELFRELMPLIEHCSCRKYEDGDPRKPGWFTVKTVDALWCVQVKDPDSCMGFTVYAETLDKALEDASLLLGCDDAPWEPDPFLARTQGRRKAS